MTLLVIVTMLLVYVGMNLILSKGLIRIVLGTSILSHSAHLFLIYMSFNNREFPFDKASKTQVDAIPQALILTAIVISFATTALLLVLVYRNHQLNKDNNVEHLGGANE